MATSLTNMLSYVRVDIREATSSYWTDAELTRYINEGIDTINRATGMFVQGPATIDLTADTATYDLASDCESPARIILLQYYDNGERIKPQTVVQFNSSMGTDLKDDSTDIAPLRWYPFGLQIGFYPVPEDDIASAIEYWYLETPDALSAGADETPYNGELDRAVEYFAAARALFGRGNNRPLAQFYWAQFLAHIDAFGAENSQVSLMGSGTIYNDASWRLAFPFQATKNQ